MSIAPLFNVLRFVPAKFGVELLSKFNPKFKNYFTNLAAHGLDVNRGLSFLADQFSNQQSEGFRAGLESREGSLRPDESAALSEIRSSQLPRQAATSLASLGVAGFLGREPEIQKPEQAQQTQAQGAQAPASPEKPKSATKGAAKTMVSDKLGDYFRKYPTLTRFLDKQISGGKSPREAANLARSSNSYRSQVADIEDDLNMDFGDVLERVFGGGASSSQTQQAAPASQGASKVDPALLQAIQELNKAMRG